MAEPATRHRWEDLRREKPNERIGRRLLAGERMPIAHVDLG